MTVSDFATFKNQFFEKLQKEIKKSVKLIDSNSKIVEYYLNSKDVSYVRDFLKQFNLIVTSPSFKKYKYAEKILDHPLFANVLAEFKESTVLILACKRPNPDAVKWLLKMDINFGVQDEEGMTALMYAVKQPILDFAVKTILKTRGDHIYYVDNKGNNALFHSTVNNVTITDFFKYVKEYNFDLNHKNYDQENLFMYCCRYKRINHVDTHVFLCKNVPFDPNETNIEGKTALMYMAQTFDYRRISAFIKDYKVDINYKSKQGHTALSCFANSYYNSYTKRIVVTEGFGLNYQSFKRAIVTIMTMIKLNCNINEPIDEYGTTLTKILLKLKDMNSYNYVVKNGGKEYDLVIENTNDPNDRYPSIDITNPIVQKNQKTVQKWIKEGIDDMSTKAGRLYNYFCELEAKSFYM